MTTIYFVAIDSYIVQDHVTMMSCSTSSDILASSYMLLHSLTYINGVFLKHIKDRTP